MPDPVTGSAARCGHPMCVDERWTTCAMPAGQCTWHPSSSMGWAQLSMLPRGRYFVKATPDGWEVYGDADNSFT